MGTEDKENFSFHSHHMGIENDPNCDIGYASFASKSALQSTLLSSTNLFDCSFKEITTSSNSRQTFITPASSSSTTAADSGVDYTISLDDDIPTSLILTLPFGDTSLPPKDVRPRKKRTANCLLKSEYPHSKRRLPFSQGDVPSFADSKRHYYNGLERLDIIAKLQPYNLVLNKILDMLDTESLHRMSVVSTTWRDIVYQNKKAFRIVSSYVKDCQSTKENLRARFSMIRSSTLRQSLESIYEDIPRNPTLLLSGTIEKSSSEKMMKCPRCNRCARVITKRNPFLVSQSTSDRLTLSYNDDVDDDDDGGDERFGEKIISEIKNSTMTEPEKDILLPIANYGLCIGLSCQFQFCLKCLCKYHPGESCRLTQLGTPSKVNSIHLSPHNSPVKHTSKNKKKNSLRRLCF